MPQAGLQKSQASSLALTLRVTREMATASGSAGCKKKKKEWRRWQQQKVQKWTDKREHANKTCKAAGLSYTFR